MSEAEERGSNPSSSQANEPASGSGMDAVLRGVPGASSDAASGAVSKPIVAGTVRDTSNHVLIDGIHIPLTVPFYRDGRSYLRKLEHNVARYSLTPAAGMVALSPGSEGTTLSDEEALETLQIVGATAAAEKVLIAAISQDSVRGALRLAEQAYDSGFDAVLLSAPPLWRRLVRDDQPARELMVFFRAVADASPLPVLLSSDGGQGGNRLEIESVGALASHPNISGIYDAELSEDRYRALVAATSAISKAQREVTVTTVFAPVTRRMLTPAPAAVGAGQAAFVTAAALSGSAGAVSLAGPPPAPTLKTRTRRIGFQIMAAGRATSMVALLEAGVAGAMPALAACAPQGCYEVYAAFKDGDPGLAREKEQRLVAADHLLSSLGVAGTKFGCDWNGYYGGVPRLPRLPLDASQRVQVERVLAGLRN